MQRKGKMSLTTCFSATHITPKTPTTSSTLPSNLQSRLGRELLSFLHPLSASQGSGTNQDTGIPLDYSPSP